MKEIIDGFLKFQRSVFPERAELFRSLANQQNPRALFISCSDSRLVPELVTQREPGDLFVIRNAGNIVPSYGPEPGGVTASVEYAVSVLKVNDIVILETCNLPKFKDTKPKNKSNIDELTKLAELLEKGLLTKEEFETQKTKILNA